DQWICIGFGAASSSVLVWQTFALNARYGEHGLMKLGAARSHPRYLINYIQNDNTGKQVPPAGGGAWLHHLQRRRHHGGF
ncbi:DUF4133 domain-containing protein, partial [Bacteroides ovatus]|uniref:DUF4133 domain-containing protein n=1 Tax=Bacteroides ovatus TaxID=28116 RepID=UPI0022E1A5C5